MSHEKGTPQPWTRLFSWDLNTLGTGFFVRQAGFNMPDQTVLAAWRLEIANWVQGSVTVRLTFGTTDANTSVLGLERIDFPALGANATKFRNISAERLAVTTGFRGNPLIVYPPRVALWRLIPVQPDNDLDGFPDPVIFTLNLYGAFVSVQP